MAFSFARSFLGKGERERIEFHLHSLYFFHSLFDFCRLVVGSEGREDPCHSLHLYPISNQSKSLPKKKISVCKKRSSNLNECGIFFYNISDNQINSNMHAVIPTQTSPPNHVNARIKQPPKKEQEKGKKTKQNRKIHKTMYSTLPLLSLTIGVHVEHDPQRIE